MWIEILLSRIQSAQECGATGDAGKTKADYIKNQTTTKYKL
jgi:hypothetical protein